MSPQAIMGGVQMAAGAAQAIGGLIGMRKKKKELAANIEAMGTYRPDQGIMQAAEAAKMRSTAGLSGASKKLATQGIESAAQGTMGATQDRRAGLGLVGTGEAMKQKGALQLAKMEEEARLRNEATAMSGARMAGAEKEKSFKSAQEKQALKVDVSAQEVAAKRAAISQGLGAVAGGVASFGAGGGKASDVTKGIGAMFGIGKGKRQFAKNDAFIRSAIKTPPQVIDENVPQ